MSYLRLLYLFEVDVFEMGHQKVFFCHCTYLSKFLFCGNESCFTGLRIKIVFHADIHVTCSGMEKKPQLLKIENSVEVVNKLNRASAESTQMSTSDLNVTQMESVDSDGDSDIEWSEGRRVVDLGQLANDLNNCKYYSNQLNLLDTVKEQTLSC